MAERPRISDETLSISGEGWSASVDLMQHDHRDTWMPADYDAFAVMLRFDDSSMDLKYVKAQDAKSGLLQLAERWEALAAALRQRADHG